MDGIHTGAKCEDADWQCMLVIIGVTPQGKKPRKVIADGFRESKASWAEVPLVLKARGLQSGPLLAAGGGTIGF